MLKKVETFAAVNFVRSLRLIESKNRTTRISMCKTAISALLMATEGVKIIGQDAEKDLAALIFKLDNALIRLEAKPSDAIKELNVFQDKIRRLDAQGKINQEDSANLATCAYECIEYIKEIEL